MVARRRLAQAALLVLLAVDLTQGRAAARCDLEAGNKLPVTGTSWVVAIRGYACGFGTGSVIDLAAINTDSGKIITLAKGEDLDKATISLDKTGSVTVRIPNMSDIFIRMDSFSGIKVTYEYYPTNDPDERERYFVWTHNRREENNKIWYCTHVMPKMSASNQILNDELLGWSLYDPHGSRKSYCKPP